MKLGRLFCFVVPFLATYILMSRARILDDKDEYGLKSLGCYKCSSVNGSDPDCEDEFVAKEEYYTPNCMAARKSYNSGDAHNTQLRIGLYPATSCIKFVAKNKDTGDEYIIRDCATDSGGMTYDTEIGGMTHCGLMKSLSYNNVLMQGCILTCKVNGCNKGYLLSTSVGLMSGTLALVLFRSYLPTP